MDELVNAVSKKTGLPPDQARAATQAVLDWLMQKLPAPVSGQIQAALQGGGLADAAKNLGGMVGKK
jgi:hypothetical protein